MAPREDAQRGHRHTRGTERTGWTPDRSSRDAIHQRRLLRAAGRGDPSARERLVRGHLPLIRSLASRYQSYGLAFDDLVQEGALGLLDAIDRYDPCRSTSFETYARFRIRRAICDALSEQARLIRLPKHIVERRRALDRAEARLLAIGSRVTPAALAAATGLSLEAVLEARAAPLTPMSLDEPAHPDGSALATLVLDPTGNDPEAEALAHERTSSVRSALAALPARQRRIVSAQWGLEGAPAGGAGVARELRLSPRRAQTIGQDALYALRRELEPAEMTP
jgi:RNA polymerase primary sigma factor